MNHALNQNSGTIHPSHYFHQVKTMRLVHPWSTQCRVFDTCQPSLAQCQHLNSQYHRLLTTGHCLSLSLTHNSDFDDHSAHISFDVFFIYFAIITNGRINITIQHKTSENVSNYEKEEEEEEEEWVPPIFSSGLILSRPSAFAIDIFSFTTQNRKCINISVLLLVDAYMHMDYTGKCKTKGEGRGEGRMMNRKEGKGRQQKKEYQCWCI